MSTDLSLWNDGPATSAIVDFVARVTEEGGPHYVEPAARIAVFDNDGTLWPEKPLPIQLDFTVRRFGELAAEHGELRDQQPYRAAYTKDFGWLNEAMVKHYRGDDSDLKLLLVAVPKAFEAVTIEEYDRMVRQFFAEADHPKLNRRYLSCGYAPMNQFLRYLESFDFTNYIASGGDRDFMRPIAGPMYGIEPQYVIGSAIGLEYDDRDGQSSLMYKGSMDFFDDGPEKPIRIWSRIGRRPLIAFGNANGDVPMLAFAGGPELPALRLLLHHDDADREFAYDAGAEQALQLAAERGWTVVSVKDDWTDVFGPTDPAAD